MSWRLQVDTTGVLVTLYLLLGAAHVSAVQWEVHLPRRERGRLCEYKPQSPLNQITQLHALQGRLGLGFPE
jgi:hypothetical protein